MKCNICGTPYRKIENSLVCAQGHTIQNTLEIADDTTGRHGRGKILRTEKVKSSAPAVQYDPSISKFMVFHMLFKEAMEFFRFKNNTVYKNFMGLFSLRNIESGAVAEKGSQDEIPLSRMFYSQNAWSQENESAFFSQPLSVSNKEQAETVRIENSSVLSVSLLATLIYMSKRADEESKDRIYRFNDFYDKFAKFSLRTRVERLSKAPEVPYRAIKCFQVGAEKVNIYSTMRMMKQIADYDRFIVDDFVRHHMTGVIRRQAEDCKFNIRREFRRDKEFLQKYFANICSEISVKITDEIQLYFDKLVYSYDHNTSFIPEVLFSTFIANYFIGKECFENSSLERDLLRFLKADEKRLGKILRMNSRFFNAAASPETYLEYKAQKDSKKVLQLEYAMCLIEMHKRNAEKIERYKENQENRHSEEK